jgi:hypothetical protein
MFSEITLRALLRLHHDYLACSVPQERIPLKNQSLSRGPGVALADELTVCAAIAQEFLASRLPRGQWVNGEPTFGIAKGPRDWVLVREHPYPDSTQRCDFWVNRVDPKKKFLPCFVEAKRLFKWTYHLETPKPAHVRLQINDIRKDIKKLREFESSFSSLSKAPRGYILVWNVASKKIKKTWIMPKEFLKKLNDRKVKPWQIRMWPLAASRDGMTTFSETAVDTWLWTVLAEVTTSRPRDIGYAR